MIAVPSAKLVPPAFPPAVIARPHLEARAQEVLGRTLTTVIAGAGFGKTTLLATWARSLPAAWYGLDRRDTDPAALTRGLLAALQRRGPAATTGLPDVPTAAGPDAGEGYRVDALAAALCEFVDGQEPGGPVVLMVDDVHELQAGAPAVRVLETLCRQAPEHLHLVYSSREELPFPVARLRGQGRMLELGPQDLLLSHEELADVAHALLGDTAEGIIAAVAELTAGWPAAVRLALESLRPLPADRRLDAVPRLQRRGTALLDYLASEVFASEPEPVRHLVAAVAPLHRFTVELCDALALPQAADVVGHLLQRGLIIEESAAPGWYALNDLVRAYALAEAGLSDDDRASLARRASGWLEAHGMVEEAVPLLAALPDHQGVARLLTDHGLRLVAAGAADTVVRAAQGLPDELISAPLAHAVGQARQALGDWDGALDAFRRVADDEDDLPAATAWRMGLIHYMRGEPDAALAVFRRVRLDGADLRNEAMLHGWRATAHWMRGELAECATSAAAAAASAEASHDLQARAVAHTALALTASLTGEREENARQYQRALALAQEAGDVLQMARIRSNLASHCLEEGRAREGLAHIEASLGRAESAGFTPLVAQSLCNRGEAHFRLGACDEAVRDYRQSLDIYRRIGSQRAAYPLAALGDVHRERGELALAGACYEEAVVLAEEAGDVHSLVPALAGLARLRAFARPGEARELAERAVAERTSLGHVAAVLARGWVVLLAGELDEAGDAAVEAGELARARRDRPALAESLELSALASRQPGLLAEASHAWGELGNPLARARCAFAHLRLRDQSGDDEAVAAAQRSLRALGVRPRAAAAAGLLAAVGLGAAPALAVEALGEFRLLRDGHPVAAAEWPSQDAAALVKALVVRRGRPTAREQLIDQLWAGEEPARVADRLTQAVASARAVLDPQDRHPPDRFLLSDRHTIALDLRHLDVDVERFLVASAEGHELDRAGQHAAAVERWAVAETCYSGDLLAGEDDGWVAPLREELRSIYLGDARALARAAVAARDHEAAARYLLRVLAHDPDDEDAHLQLVAVLLGAGRLGEARRSYRAYAARMDALGVECAPFPSPAP